MTLLYFDLVSSSEGSRLWHYSASLMKIRTDFYRIMPQQVAKFVVEEITACQSFMRLICAQTTTTKTMDNFFFGK